ncbi:maleylpyruvate isomerase family mycothiol-dependent enzyme [Nakamurella sp.]|uniref:maleylpyruvate isomerase family mycothiol-dependent enzyme n=1 Tax=Nakamurella sp. TaxID=1869182 RepID=UPI003783EF98
MDTSTRNETSARYADANRPLTAVLDAVPGMAWTRPSPCEGWAARDVVRHLIDTQRDFLTGRGFDPGAAPDVDADPAAAWRAHTSAVGELLARPEVPDTGYDGWFGPTTVGQTLVQFYVPDMVVHRWDIAAAVGGDTTLSEVELDRTAESIESWGEAMYMDGICKPGLEPPAGASRQVVLLARMGRRDW